jgi:hypothetical protein
VEPCHRGFVSNKFAFPEFELAKTEICAALHVFDLIKFCSSMQIDDAHDRLEARLKEKLGDHKRDSFASREYFCYQAKTFVQLNEDDVSG